MPLLYTKQGHTGILTFSRPKARNCWGPDYAEGLIRHLDEAADDDEIRSVILTGDEAGGAFSAGANLSDPKTHNTRRPRPSSSGWAARAISPPTWSATSPSR